jgi:hypothetical protein
MTRNINYIITVFTLLLSGLFLSRCGNNTSKNIPDVSDIPVQVTLQRFDQALFSQDTAKMEEGLRNLAQQYPDFLPFFITEIAHDQSNADELPLEAVTGFVSAPQVRRLYDSCQVAFPNLTQLSSDLEQMLRFYRHYFPNKPLPRFVTTVTEFIGDAYVVNDSLVMIGLDMFLGENFSGYNPDYFPQYLRRQFAKEYMTTKVAMVLATRLAGPPPGDHILDYMINNGKILYLMDALIPTVPDSIKMGYTKAQMEGCYVNEQEVWAKLLELKVLYQPLNNKNQKIVTPSPSSDIVFVEAPGEIGNWIGWQIVKAYMSRYPETSLDELLNLRDTQQFLEKAKYKPKRVN